MLAKPLPKSRDGLASLLTGLAYRDAYVLAEHLRAVGGWRGVFDSLSSEWQHCPVTEKLRFLKAFMEKTGHTLDHVGDVYWLQMRSDGRPDIADALRYGLALLAQAAIKELDRSDLERFVDLVKEEGNGDKRP